MSNIKDFVLIQKIKSLNKKFKTILWNQDQILIIKYIIDKLCKITSRHVKISLRKNFGR